MAAASSCCMSFRVRSFGILCPQARTKEDNCLLPVWSGGGWIRRRKERFYAVSRLATASFASTMNISMIVCV